jgi:hypothetical protein
LKGYQNLGINDLEADVIPHTRPDRRVTFMTSKWKRTNLTRDQFLQCSGTPGHSTVTTDSYATLCLMRILGLRQDELGRPFTNRRGTTLIGLWIATLAVQSRIVAAVWVYET